MDGGHFPYPDSGLVVENTVHKRRFNNPYVVRSGDWSRPQLQLRWIATGNAQTGESQGPDVDKWIVAYENMNI